MIAWLRRWWAAHTSNPERDIARARELLVRRVGSYDQARMHEVKVDVELLRRDPLASPEKSPEEVRPDSRKVK